MYKINVITMGETCVHDVQLVTAGLVVIRLIECPNCPLIVVIHSNLLTAAIYQLGIGTSMPLPLWHYFCNCQNFKTTIQ